MILEMEKTKFVGMDGTPTIVFRQKGVAPVTAFTITCTPTGISFKNKMIGELEGQLDLRAFAKLMDEVWRERSKLRNWKAPVESVLEKQ